MEWFILLLVVPAVLVPIVLLFGFAGCGSFLPLDDDDAPVSAPVNLHATHPVAKSGNSLNWQNTDASISSSQIERNRLGADPNVEPPTLIPHDSPAPGFLDPFTPATSGTTFEYKVQSKNSAGGLSAFSNVAKATMFPAAPQLTSVLLSAELIRVSWPPSPNATKYRLQHLPDLAIVYDGPNTSVDHAVPPGTQHSYQVIAIVENGFVDSVSKAVESLPSAASIPITTPNWTIAFTTANIPPNPQSGTSANGDCIVQRIPAPTVSGTAVRLTLRGIVNQTTALSAVSISRAVPVSAPQPWNSVDPPVEVKFGGMSGVTLLNGQTALSDTILFPVTAGQDLHVAFDVSPTSERILRRNVPGALAYSRKNTAEAVRLANGTPATVRSPNYNTQNNDVYCIELIEVS